MRNMKMPNVSEIFEKRRYSYKTIKQQLLINLCLIKKIDNLIHDKNIGRFIIILGNNYFAKYCFQYCLFFKTGIYITNTTKSNYVKFASKKSTNLFAEKIKPPENNLTMKIS